MTSNQVFADMTPEEAQAFLEELKADAPNVAQVALHAACGAFKLRPQFIRRQPRERQAEWVRKALGRKSMAAVAEEILAEYFLEHHGALLGEWLDLLGLKHEDGSLEESHPECPAADALAQAVEKFRGGDHPERRELLLRAFAGQSAIDWPALDSLVAARPA